MDCLDKFCNLSGQKVSLQKSSICVSNNVSKEVADSIARKAGIPLEKDMGLPGNPLYPWKSRSVPIPTDLGKDGL